MSVVAPLVIGLAFGWLLQRAGLSRYDRIVEIYRFRDFAVLKFLLSALVTGAITIRLLGASGLAVPFPVPATYVVGNFAGGVVFGVGMALSGFCPGTVAAGAGEGRLDYLVAGGLGLYAGAVVYGLAYERVMPALARIANAGGATLPDVLRVEPWLVIVLLAELTLILFYAIERRAPRRPRQRWRRRALR